MPVDALVPSASPLLLPASATAASALAVASLWHCTCPWAKAGTVSAENNHKHAANPGKSKRFIALQTKLSRKTILLGSINAVFSFYLFQNKIIYKTDLETGKSVCIGDAAGQANQAMFNIKILLEETGSNLSHITKIVIYIIDPRYREDVYRTTGRWLKGVYPVSTGLVVDALARPEWLVEIDATAVIPDA